MGVKFQAQCVPAGKGGAVATSSFLNQAALPYTPHCVLISGCETALLIWMKRWMRRPSGVTFTLPRVPADQAVRVGWKREAFLSHAHSWDASRV